MPQAHVKVEIKQEIKHEIKQVDRRVPANESEQLAQVSSALVRVPSTLVQGWHAASTDRLGELESGAMLLAYKTWLAAEPSPNAHLKTIYHSKCRTVLTHQEFKEWTLEDVYVVETLLRALTPACCCFSRQGHKDGTDLSVRLSVCFPGTGPATTMQASTAVKSFAKFLSHTFGRAEPPRKRRRVQ